MFYVWYLLPIQVLLKDFNAFLKFKKVISFDIPSNFWEILSDSDHIFLHLLFQIFMINNWLSLLSVI